MKTEMFNFDLPSELIAQKPAESRSESRLLVVERGQKELVDSKFSLIGEFLREGDCLVINNTKVLQARFFGFRDSGARLEGLFLCEVGAGQWKVMLKGARKVKVGEVFNLASNRDTGESAFRAVLKEKDGEGGCVIELVGVAGLDEVLEEIGFPPLPPYIKRTDDFEQAKEDKGRYQTVYAEKAGAVAAPTAGLHFTDELIGHLKEDVGVRFASVTLAVGAGTFKPVTAEHLEDHEIHSEVCSVDEENAEKINRAKSEGSRIIAVGTTSVRTLESMVDERGLLQVGEKSTRLFITPGYEFKIVDAMVTNFHLPKSTLLALVSSFAGLDRMLEAYRHAVEQRYRFFSYGDSMFLY